MHTAIERGSGVFRECGKTGLEVSSFMNKRKATDEPDTVNTKTRTDSSDSSSDEDEVPVVPVAPNLFPPNERVHTETKQGR